MAGCTMAPDRMMAKPLTLDLKLRIFTFSPPSIQMKAKTATHRGTALHCILVHGSHLGA
jgi:hypothetical protein